MKQHEIITGDWRDERAGLVRLGPLSVDHVITDPPYSKHSHDAQRQGATGYTERKGRAAQISRSRSIGFACLTKAERQEAAHVFALVARRWVLVFTDDLKVNAWRKALIRAGLNFVRIGVWHKLNAPPQFNGDRPGQCCEYIVIAHQPTPKGWRSSRARPRYQFWNGGGMPAFWEHAIVMDRAHDGARLHETQKPLPLMEDLVRQFTLPGELIADPYTGSGTTQVAAKLLGRRSIGWEISHDDAAKARARIAVAGKM